MAYEVLPSRDWDWVEYVTEI